MNSRETALDILQKILNRKAFSNIALGNELNNSNLSEKDKSLVTEIVYGTLRYKYSIDKILNKFITRKLSDLDDIILNILRITVYQLRYLDRIPEFASVNEAVNMAKKHKSIGASKFVNGVLRNYLRNKNLKYTDGSPIEDLYFKYSCEKWMADLFISQYGSLDAEKILNGLNCTPSVTVRANLMKCSQKETVDKLKKLGYDVEKGLICPEAIRILKGGNIENNQLFKDGYISVQDESAMLVANSMELKENMTVLDLCSAPGGKACHMAEIMKNSGKIKAFDIHKNKLPLITKSAGRLGIDNMSCQVSDAEVLNEELVNTADRVLCDVPCSGLGIIRRKPEIKWTKNKDDLNRLPGIQRKILVNAGRYLKKGGILLYSTCTLNKNENEENIKWFVSKFHEYKIEPLYYGDINNIIYHDEGFVTILPDEFMDGFFVAKLKKIVSD